MNLPASESAEIQPVAHTVFEDVFGVLTGTFVASLGIYLLEVSHTVTGGTAGLGLVLSYAFNLPFGIVYFLVTLPFFALALWKRGWQFTLRSLVSLALVSGFSLMLPLMVPTIEINMIFGVTAGNVLVGIGLLILFRHKSSLGGYGVLALVAQDLWGWRAGYIQMVLDGVTIICGLFVVSGFNVIVSFVGGIILNLSIALNHRPGRYVGY